MKIQKTYSENTLVLIVLFITELLALTAFNFFNIVWVFRIVGFLIVIFCLPHFVKKYQQKHDILFYASFIGLICFVLPATFFGKTGHEVDWFIKISLFLGVIPFFVLGAFLGKGESSIFNVKKAIMAFYIGIGFYILISLFITIYQYGSPFYYLIYSKDPKYADVINDAYILIGLKTHRVSISLFANYALIASTGLIGMIFVDYKRNRNLWLVLCFGGLSGLITLISLAISLPIYIFLLLLLLAILIKKWELVKKRKILVLSGLMSLLGLFVVAEVAYRVDLFGFQGAINKTYILKEFLNININASIRAADFKISFRNISLFGNYAGSFGFKTINTGTVFFDILYNSGLIACLGLIAFFVSVGFSVKKYLYSKDAFDNKMIILFILLTFGIILCFNNYMLDLILDFVFLPILFLMGYVISFQTKDEISETNIKINTN